LVQRRVVVEIEIDEAMRWEGGERKKILGSNNK